MSVPIELVVNGKSVAVDVEADTLLSSFLREHLRLTGHLPRRRRDEAGILRIDARHGEVRHNLWVERADVVGEIGKVNLRLTHKKPAHDGDADG